MLVLMVSVDLVDCHLLTCLYCLCLSMPFWLSLGDRIRLAEFKEYRQISPHDRHMESMGYLSSAYLL